MVTQCAPKVHFGDGVESFLSGDVPQLKSDWFVAYAGLEFGGEVAADGGPYFFVELVVDVLVEHGGLAHCRLPHHAEFYDYVLLHQISDCL